MVFVAILEKWPQTEGGEVVITSGDDSHDAGLHPVVRAVDIRTHNILAHGDERGPVLWQLRDKLKERLGKDFDVKLESLGFPQEHIHIEYDPNG